MMIQSARCEKSGHAKIRENPTEGAGVLKPPPFPRLFWALIFSAMFESAQALNLPIHDLDMWYEFPKAGSFNNQEVFFTWENDPVLPQNMGVFASFYFVFQNRVGGYIGAQKDGTGKKAIFSIWDAGSTPSAQPSRPAGNCKRFAHEGLGTTCTVPYSWVVGHEYRVKVLDKGRGTGVEEWEGSIFDTTSGVETRIGTIALSDNAGYGQLNNNPAIFFEHYGSAVVDSCAALPYAKLTWRGPYANNALNHDLFKPPFTAKQAGAVSRTCANNTTTPSKKIPGLTLEAGGAVGRSISPNLQLTIPPELLEGSRDKRLNRH